MRCLIDLDLEAFFLQHAPNVRIVGLHTDQPTVGPPSVVRIWVESEKIEPEQQGQLCTLIVTKTPKEGLGGGVNLVRFEPVNLT